MKTVFALVGSTVGCNWGWRTGPLPIRPYKETLVRPENDDPDGIGWLDITGERTWPEYTAPANYTGGDLVDGKFRCYSCAGLASDCKSEATKHLAETLDPDMKFGFDATSTIESDWEKPGYCLTNYACFHQTVNTFNENDFIKRRTVNGEEETYKDYKALPNIKTKELVRMGCLSDTNYQSWGIVDECMDFDFQYDLENYKDKKGLKYLYNYDFDGNPEGGVYGEDRAYVTRMCIQTFIGSLEGDGVKCKDQDNAPGKEIDDATGDEISCSKYIPPTFSNWEIKESEFRPNGW